MLAELLFVFLIMFSDEHVCLFFMSFSPQLNTSFDGSVLMLKMIDMIEGKLKEAKEELARQNYQFTFPLPDDTKKSK